VILVFFPKAVTNSVSDDGATNDSALCEASDGMKFTVSPTSTFKYPGLNTIISPLLPVVTAFTVNSAA
jgi:hypothetical protein